MKLTAVFALVVCSALAVLLSCDEQASSEPNQYEALFANLPEPDVNNAYVFAAPNGGETYRIGDTITIVFKRDTTRALCTGIHLSPDSGLEWGWVSGEAPIGSGFGDVAGLGIPPVVYVRYGDIHVVKWEVTDSIFAYPGYYATTKISTQGSSCVLRLSDNVGDCCCAVVAVPGAPFAIVP